jgi:hypothetical protein
MTSPPGICAERPRPALGRRRPPATVALAMPKLWIYTQALIVLFVVVGMVIAVTKLV